MTEKLPRSAKLLLAVSGGLGVLVAIQGAVMAIKDFFWFHFLINIAYFACFTLIFIYASHRTFPSRVLFPLVNCLYGAIVLLTGEGTDPARPVCVCAEGSLVQKSRVYRPCLEQLLREEIGEKLGRHAVLQVSSETTLAGSAAAALLNT